MTSRTRRTISGISFVVGIALTAPAAMAQTHMQGSAWIHRNSEHATMLHAEDDSLCTAEFPAGCLGGGMMGPDSIYCEFEIAPSDSAPHDCVVVVHCEVFDEDGGGMMSGHMTPRGLFQREVHLTFHYDREYVMGLGIDPGNLVITTWVGDTFTIVEEATHDLVAGVFRFSSSNLTSWYGIADRSDLPVAVQEATWGRFKDSYR